MRYISVMPSANIVFMSRHEILPSLGMNE